MAVKQMEAADVPDAKHDAEMLYCWLMHVQPDKFFMEWANTADDRTCDQYFALVDRRSAREPLQYIIGTQEFMGYTMKTSPHVLIPRFDTEPVVEKAVGLLEGQKAPAVLDLCCGSGAIGIAVAKMTDAKVTAADLSEDAVALTKENAASNSAALAVLQGDLFEAVGKKKYDMVISNPPYIESDVIPTLMPEVRNYEPHEALDGGADGLDFYRRIIADAPDHIKDDGLLVLEIGDDQAEAVTQLIADIERFDPAEVGRDLAGHDRIITAVMLGKKTLKARAKKRAAEEKQRAKEEAAAAKQRAKEEAAQAKQDAIDAKAKAKQDAIDAKAKAKQDAIDAKQRAKDEAAQAKQDAIDAKAKAKQDAIDAKAKAKQDAIDAKAKAKQDAIDAKNKAAEEKQRAKEEAAAARQAAKDEKKNK
jgi:release factor glutamine methyltransferase